MRKKSQSRFTSPKRWSPSKRLMLILLILIIGALGFAWHQHHVKKASLTSPPSGIRPNNSIDYSPASPADNNVNNSRKGSGSTASTLDSYQSPPNTGSFYVTVTRANVDSAAQKLQVATLINGAASGTCTLNVHQAGQQTVTQIEAITLQVNNYVCPVFNVPLSDFSNRGDWNISVTVTSAGKTVSDNWASNPVSLSG